MQRKDGLMETLLVVLGVLTLAALFIVANQVASVSLKISALNERLNRDR